MTSNKHASIMKAWVSGSNNQDRGANITCGKRCNCGNFTANKEIRENGWMWHKMVFTVFMGIFQNLTQLVYGYSQFLDKLRQTTVVLSRDMLQISGHHSCASAQGHGQLWDAGTGATSLNLNKSWSISESLAGSSWLQAKVLFISHHISHMAWTHGILSRTDSAWVECEN